VQQLGWTESHNVRLDIRRGGGDTDAIRKHATELAALAPDVIMAIGGTATGRLLQVTRTVPCGQGHSAGAGRRPLAVTCGEIAGAGRPRRQRDPLPPVGIDPVLCPRATWISVRPAQAPRRALRLTARESPIAWAFRVSAAALPRLDLTSRPGLGPPAGRTRRPAGRGRIRRPSPARRVGFVCEALVQAFGTRQVAASPRRAGGRA
jgi:hypothetical protein